MSKAAKPVKATMSPMRSWPCVTSRAPIRSTTIIETVDASRWSALAKAHQSSTGYCALISWSVRSFSARVSSVIRL